MTHIFPQADAKDHRGNPIPGAQGMTLRDWFAGQALIGLITIRSSDPYETRAYQITDAMIAAREQSNG